ncbi:hypothetical protein AGMMS49992_27850 [Clostridia bacterium]|nr:hypothetical protein AGMMS49992_27850 [Clostridia bacterium]
MAMLAAVYTGGPYISFLLALTLIAYATIKLQGRMLLSNQKLTLLIVFAKCLLALYQAKHKNLPMGGVDWWNFWRVSIDLLKLPVFKSLGTDNDLFSKITSLIFRLFGTHTMQINWYIVFSSIVAALYIEKAARKLTDSQDIANKAALLFMIWPINIVYSVTYLREMPIQCLVAASFYHFVVFVKERRIVSLLWASILILLASMMHSGVLLLFVVYIIVAFWGDRKRQSSSGMKLAAVALVAVVVFTPIGRLAASKLGISSLSVEDITSRVNQFDIEANTRYSNLIYYRP